MNHGCTCCRGATDLCLEAADWLLVLQQMTKAAVAKERAKLYMELKQNPDHQTLAANADELASMKEKYVPALLLGDRWKWRVQTPHLLCLKTDCVQDSSETERCIV